MSSLSGIDIARDGVGHLISDNRLRVPFYQRAYAWKRENVRDFFSDISRAVDEGNGKDYFLGTIVGCPTGAGDNIIEIVDGQQRLATVSILFAAIRNHLLQLGETETASEIERDYLLRKHGIRQRTEEANLVLSEIDNDFYKKRILARPTKGEASPKITRASHRLLAGAAKLASDHVKNITAGRKTGDQLAVLDKWVTFLKHNSIIIFISVPNHADAFVIFETLNDRGLELS